MIMTKNIKGAGRKAIPNGVRVTYIIPEENKQAVTDVVKSYQDAAILKEKINNLKK